MDSVIGRLTEIEDAASAIVAHAQEQKAELDREYEANHTRYAKEILARMTEV